MTPINPPIDDDGPGASTRPVRTSMQGRTGIDDGAGQEDVDVILSPTRVTLVPRTQAADTDMESGPDTTEAAVLEARSAPPSDVLPETAAVTSAHRRLDLGFFGLVPFLAYVAVFLVMPTAVLLWGAFRQTDPASGVSSFTGANISQALSGPYLTALQHSLELALVTSVVSAVFGLLLAQAIVACAGPTMRDLVSTAAAVLANFGGVLLAFMFVAVVGSAGVVTTQLQDRFGISLQDDLGFNLYSLNGVELVYLYFLIPLMVLVMTPALEGLRPQWQEAAQNLGATRRQYWRYVAGPVLAPTFIGSTVLLFCGSISAFATASALTNGSLSITTLQIDTLLSGNVITNGDGLAAALAFNLIVIVVPLTLTYQFLQRRTARWLR